jgi:hydrogenase maturation factor
MTGDDPSCSGEHCITCGDVATEMVVELVDAERGLATCRDADGVAGEVETLLVAPVQLGETLLVHAGTAIARTAETPVA